MPTLAESPRSRKLELLKSLQVPDTSGADTTQALQQLAAIYGLQQEQQANPLKLEALRANTAAQELQNQYFPDLTEQKLALGQETLTSAPVERQGQALQNTSNERLLAAGAPEAAVAAHKVQTQASLMGGLHSLYSIGGGEAPPRNMSSQFLELNYPELLQPEKAGQATAKSRQRAEWIRARGAGAPANPETEASLGIGAGDIHTPPAQQSRLQRTLTPAHIRRLLETIYLPTIGTPSNIQSLIGA